MVRTRTVVHQSVTPHIYIARIDFSRFIKKYFKKIIRIIFIIFLFIIIFIFFLVMLLMYPLLHVKMFSCNYIKNYIFLEIAH